MMLHPSAFPIPALLSGIPNPVPTLDGQPARGSQFLRPLRLRLRGDRGPARIERAPSSGDRPRQRMEPHMSDLSLAQNHALDLARTLMVPVTLFEIDGEIGVMPSAEYDGDEDAIINEYDPFAYGSAH